VLRVVHSQLYRTLQATSGRRAVTAAVTCFATLGALPDDAKRGPRTKARYSRTMRSQHGLMKPRVFVRAVLARRSRRTSASRSSEQRIRPRALLPERSGSGLVVSVGATETGWPADGTRLGLPTAARAFVAPPPPGGRSRTAWAE